MILAQSKKVIQNPLLAYQQTGVSDPKMDLEAMASNHQIGHIPKFGRFYFILKSIYDRQMLKRTI